MSVLTQQLLLDHLMVTKAMHNQMCIRAMWPDNQRISSAICTRDVTGTLVMSYLIGVAPIHPILALKVVTTGVRHGDPRHGTMATSCYMMSGQQGLGPRDLFNGESRLLC